MPTGTCPQPAPPTPHQAYRPTPWTVPPPPPYPPPVQNAAQTQQQQQQQQTAPGVQYAPSPGPYIQPAYQQISQTTIQQQQYHPVSHSYQSQYQAQQQVLQAYNPPPTPLSPPYGAQVAPQGGSGYFSATATAQYQIIHDAPKGNGQPAVQGPYTPAATPGTV
ncbi:hypothetical protein CkaCkLH20_09499 [Colletotrichum karsti]|uniref:Uncharacterized protein n=1 Tax=Colletotrichum karsti TaxID=1095194 RepID=A0A9P6HYN0_9PEZI|nr:uncharacterized protein CkaCkLH20_09499 [Colletotrichum karsti]KAF9872989.1 hypothetical protein CkaCkLH20_09499 [Colletotrichum karsti]